MTQPPDLAEVLAAAMREHWTCDCGDRAEDLDEQFAHVACEAAKAWREACTITTVEDLDRVPAGAIMQSAAGSIACRFDGRNGVVFGDDRPFPWNKLALPALLIPRWAR